MLESGKSTKRGSVDNKKRLAAFGTRGPAEGADWGTCDGELLAAVVVEITSQGGAVIFGLSRDLGAHSVTLMLDDERETLWFNGSADLDEELRMIKAKLEAMN